MSTYITAVVAGEYYEVLDAYEGTYGVIPMGHYSRQSLKAELDRDREELVLLTKQGFEFFEEAFGFPYPFEKYDQLYVPEYNMGAMENAGCVTLRDEYIPRSRQPRSFYEFRASVILHEMAHMWFGNLVTMRWWDDLWLNESFAEWACYHAEAEATSYTDAWTGFANMRKQRGYRADQLPSTHPIATDMVDLHAVEVNFDMITYAKGAAVLKQLVAWVGLEPFLSGLREYFRDHAYGNTEFIDLLTALEKASGRELDRLGPGVAADRGRQHDHAGVRAGRRRRRTRRSPSGRPRSTSSRRCAGTGSASASTTRCPIRGADGSLVRSDYVEVDVTGALTEIDELVGKAQPDLLLLNDGDLTFAKVRLDERSLATAVASLSACDDSLTRALIWSAAWDMTRDAEMTATDFVALVLGNIGSETDSWGLTAFPAFAAQAVNQFSAPANRAALRAQLGAGPAGAARGRRARHRPPADLRPLLRRRRPQRRGDRRPRGAARRLADVRRARRSTRTCGGRCSTTSPGSAGPTTRGSTPSWPTDNTISGQEHAAAARAAMPTAEAKERAWQQAMVDGSVPNETAKQVVLSFMRAGQEDLLAPYVDRYLADAPLAWDRLGAHRAAVSLEYIFPRVLASAEALAKVDAWLATEADGVNPGALRFVQGGPVRHGPRPRGPGQGRRRSVGERSAAARARPAAGCRGSDRPRGRRRRTSGSSPRPRARPRRR